MNKLAQKLLKPLLVLIILTQTTNLFWANRSQLLQPFNLQQAEYTYTHSQYNLDNAEFLGNIQDDILYSYAGYRYITGTDPSTLNPEAPYLIKYLYGISILIFTNASVIQFIFSLLLLLAIYKLTTQLTHNSNLGLTASTILASDPLFISQITQTLLDLPHALIIATSFISFNAFLNSKNPNWLILTSATIGLTATTKLFVSAFLIWFTFIYILKPSFKNLLKLTLPAIGIYILIHSVFFIHHPNPVDFFNLHLDTARLYRSYLPEYPFGEFLRIIFLGQWQTWWADQNIITVSNWSPLWPLTVISSLITLIFSLRSEHKFLSAISVFILLYLCSNLIHVVFPRYLLSILPLTIATLLYSISYGFSCIHRYRRQRS